MERIFCNFFRFDVFLSQVKHMVATEPLELKGYSKKLQVTNLCFPLNYTIRNFAPTINKQKINIGKLAV